MFFKFYSEWLQSFLGTNATPQQIASKSQFCSLISGTLLSELGRKDAICLLLLQHIDKQNYRSHMTFISGSFLDSTGKCGSRNLNATTQHASQKARIS